MSPTKQARGTQTPSVTERRKHLGRNQAQSGGQFPSGQTNQFFAAKSDQLVPVVFPDGCLGDEVLTGICLRGSSGVLDSADGQSCRSCRGGL